MGYFALISSGTTAPTVDRCHINIWRFDGWLSPRVLFFDVGLGLVTPQGQVGATRFKIALPFSCETYAHLFEPMNNPAVAQLVFGRAVDYDATNSVVSYKDKKGQRVSLKLISPKNVTLDRVKSGRNYAMWDIELTNPPGENEILYLRIRFHVENFSRSWFPHAGGELVDVRVADTRESVSISDWNCFASEIVPTPNLRVFVVAPADLEPRTSSPAYRARALERTVWRPYTGSRIWPFTRSRRFAIYAFSPDEPEPPSSHAPFRLYFSLASRRTRLWVKLLVMLAAVVLGVVLGQRIGVKDPWAGLTAWIVAMWKAYCGYIIGSISFGTVMKTREWWQRIAGLTGWLRWLDRRILFKAHR